MEFFYGFYLKVASSPAVHFMEDSLAGIHVSMHNLSLSALHPELVMFFF